MLYARRCRCGTQNFSGGTAMALRTRREPIAVPAQRNQQQRESNAHELNHRWRWWHNARDAGVGNSRLRSNTSEGGVPLEVPPPPFPSLAVPPMYGGVALSLASSICPICLRPQQNAAASPSGFVFCYRCLVARVVEMECCFITHVPEGGYPAPLRSAPLRLWCRGVGL